MTIVRKLVPILIDDYLRIEEMSEVRHEYVQGVIQAMVGGSARHNLITSSVMSLLRAHLRDRPCYVFMSDMKVRIGEVFYYPDVMVVCGQLEPTALYQTQPVLLVEVLSDSTEAKDRLEKLVAYQSLPSVKEYLLVAQDKVSADLYRRVGETWQVENLGYGDRVAFESVELSVPIETLYEDLVGIDKPSDRSP